MDFDQYQSKAHETATTTDIDVYSLGLIGEAGSVASSLKKFKRDSASRDLVRRDIQEELGDVLWYLAEIATRFDIKLNDVATSNVAKTEYLFKSRAKDFDEGFPEVEVLPRLIEIRFDDDGHRLQLLAEGRPIGNPLTDNAYADDGYRYHDAFHLAYMTLLGWSPVMRRLLQCKRKSKPNVDEVEDGARARALEEGISILAFSQSEPPRTGASLFADHTQIPFWLLEGIKKMTANLEVSAKSVTEWREAIAAGFDVFDRLRANRGGYVVCDLNARKMMFRK